MKFRLIRKRVPEADEGAAPKRGRWPMRRWPMRLLYGGVAVLALWMLFVLAGETGLEWYTGIRNGRLTYDSVQKLTPQQFEALATGLVREARQDAMRERATIVPADGLRGSRVSLLAQAGGKRDQRALYPHIEYFRRAGIRSYTGPETCLQCHKTMTVHGTDGRIREVDTIADVLDTTHYKFQQSAGFTTVGYDGRTVDGPGTRPIPVGKIDRACGIPGSFSWTGWAALVASKPESAHGKTVMRSEGCGQCHIGGNYHPATEEMLPGFNATKSARHGLDCLICHSDRYDMNYRYVIKDRTGIRWNQDRTMRAALTVGIPQAKNCLNCHQHNMGGDTYAYNTAARSLGYKNPRLLHPSAKRANGFDPHDDVHAKAGLGCLDCHTAVGHKIARGTLGTDLVSNDLPGVEVSCQKCHTATPHDFRTTTGARLNAHAGKIACETCHIPELGAINIVLRDWIHPTWNKEEGVYLPTDIYVSGKPDKGFTYMWFNGTGTFLANALGDNPEGGTGYNPLMNQMTRLKNPSVRTEILRANAGFFRANKLDPNAYLTPALDTLTQLDPATRKRRAQMIESNLRPAMRQGRSKIYPLKLFNARMYEDMSNRGPFGAMILPFDYPTYYETGNSYNAMVKAVSNPIVKRMYQTPFKLYMMDDFMRYFGVGTWSNAYPLDKENRGNIEPHWMRQMGTLMVNHSIKKNGRMCNDCHSPRGILDFKALGYSPARVRELQQPRAAGLVAAR